MTIQNSFTDAYEARYREMRAGAVRVEGELLDRLTAACQKNPWLKRGGVDFDDLYVESDYPYYLERYEDLSLLKMFFEHGNWGLRSAVQYRDLIFVQQVNGGDEWWTLKINGDRLVPFESITFRTFILCDGRPDGFTALIENMHTATVEQCKSLTYSDPRPERMAFQS